MLDSYTLAMLYLSFTWYNVGRFLLAAAFTFVGVKHFTSPKPFIRIMPKALKSVAAEAVYISGAAEIAGGLGLIAMAPPSCVYDLPFAAPLIAAFPFTTAEVRSYAAYGLLALLIAVFPANINMAVNKVQISADPKQAMPTWALYARLPFQFVLMYLVSLYA